MGLVRHDGVRLNGPGRVPVRGAPVKGIRSSSVLRRDDERRLTRSLAKPTMQTMRFRGFTLVELIAVIAIVTFLAALLFPALHSAHEHARATVCQAHIRDLAIQFHQYEAEHETLPYGIWGMRPAPPSGYLCDPSYDLPGWYWPDFIGAVVHRSPRDRKILECPSNRVEDIGLSRNILFGNYGVNRSLCRSAVDVTPYKDQFPGPPLSTSTIRHPAATLLLVDSGYTLVCWWDTIAEPPHRYSGTLAVGTAYMPGLAVNKDKELLPGQIDDAIGGRHPNKTVNVAFADGHVDRTKAETLAVEQTCEADEQTYRNRTPLWIPR